MSLCRYTICTPDAELNFFHDDLKFVIIKEEEVNGKIPFLDILGEIHRKPTHK